MRLKSCYAFGEEYKLALVLVPYSESETLRHMLVTTYTAEKQHLSERVQPFGLAVSQKNLE